MLRVTLGVWLTGLTVVGALSASCWASTVDQGCSGSGGGSGTFAGGALTGVTSIDATTRTTLVAGMPFSGPDITGTIDGAIVGDDSHNHTSTTISGLDISADTNLAGTDSEIVLTNDTLSLASSIDLTGHGPIKFPAASAPTIDAVGKFSLDTNEWAVSHGTYKFHDGTAAVNLVATTAADTPSNGQVPTWKTGGTIDWETPPGTGDVVGPASATANALARYSGTTGKLLKDSGVTVDDAGNMTVTGTLTAGGGTDTMSWATGVLTLASVGHTNNENLLINLEGTANTGTISSGTGVTKLSFTSIGSAWGANVTPVSSDGAALGTTALMWSDLFLASGAVINFNNGDVTLTHSADTLTMAGGALVLGTPLAFGSGGTGLSTAADDTILNSNGSAWSAEAVPNCTDTGGNHLNYTTSSNAFSCGTSGGGSGTDISVRAIKNATQSTASGTEYRVTFESEAAPDGFDTDTMHFTSDANLTGTVAKTSGSATLTGTSTAFTTELSTGQVLCIPDTSGSCANSYTTNDFCVVTAIATNTSLTCNQTMEASASGQTARRDASWFVARTAGKYVIQGSVSWASDVTKYAFLSRLVSGADADGQFFQGTGGSSNAGDTTSVSVLYNASQWDAFSVVAQQSTGTVNLRGTLQCSLSMVKQ